ncbi:MAG: hypothetical protein WC683_06335 [bacterium]
MTGLRRIRRARNASRRRAEELAAAWQAGHRAATIHLEAPRYGDVDLDLVDRDRVYVELQRPVLVSVGRHRPAELDVATVRLNRVRKAALWQGVRVTWTGWEMS